MASVAVTTIFANNTVADGSQVNTNFSDLVTYINNRNDASANWDRLSVLSSSAVPFIADNSTGTANIADFKDNGSIVFSVVDGGYCRFSNGTVALPSVSFINDTDSGLYWINANEIGIATGGVKRFGIDSVGSAVFSGSVYLGSGTISSPILSFANDVNTGIYWAQADELGFATGGVARLNIGLTDTTIGTNFLPNGAGLRNSGNASDYWNDISYKTLTDRGCLGSFDKGVELQDGRIVSDTEALLEIKIHPTKKTIYGVDMFDYRTFPKASYKKADKAGVALPRDINDEPIGGADGIEMTSMFSIMIGAIKELTNRIKVLEAKNG